MTEIMSCPLCGQSEAELYWCDARREYRQCGCCRLVFVPRHQYLSAAQEKAHYDLHINSPEDQGYRRFLGRLFDPMVEKLAPAAEGLDFGSGPGPTLSVMFDEAGFATATYDIYYARNEPNLLRDYDFVTASEVVEHLSQPGEVLDKLWSILKPCGWLGLMTKLVANRQAFSRWHYKNDPTHISFFSRDTFVWLGDRWQSTPLFFGADVVLFQKQD